MLALGRRFENYDCTTFALWSTPLHMAASRGDERVAALLCRAYVSSTSSGQAARDPRLMKDFQGALPFQVRVAPSLFLFCFNQIIVALLVVHLAVIIF